MNRISGVFSDLKSAGEKAFIVYLTAGYPEPGMTAELAFEISKNGADIIELGIPFSDPLADGPVIQASSREALARGISADKIFKTAREIRRKSSVPLVFMSYYNPVYSYGLTRFTGIMADAGVDGIIVPDLPLEESGPLREACWGKKISFIPLAASNTPPGRQAEICKTASGFVYCLSHIGITGTRNGIERGAAEFIKGLRKITDKPLAVGFGVSKHEHVKLINSFADGVIVGSAVIEFIGRNKTKKNLSRLAGAFSGRLKSG